MLQPKLPKEVIRNLSLYEFELNHDAETAAANIRRAKGRQVVSERKAYPWFAKFRAGNADLEDQPREGRPQEVDRDAVVDAIDLDPTMSTEVLAKEFGCTQRHI